ncbi:MAG: hypothetical protein LBD24_04340 [Spirochaetaceae bacterium]|jgi:hypothetical protein|nr:hypothetical protein [Spirochaetaceae bacterium]
MYHNKHWLPSTRRGILNMARVWDTILPTKILAWDIPPNEYQEFHDLVMIARAALDEAETSPRSEVINTKVRVAFENLIAKMVFFHEQYYNSPLLTQIDRAASDGSLRLF